MQRDSKRRFPALSRDREERRVHEDPEHETERHGRRDAAAPQQHEPDPAWQTGTCGAALTPLPSIKFDSAAGARSLQAHYKVTALDGFGAFTRAELSAAGSLIASEAGAEVTGLWGPSVHEETMVAAVPGVAAALRQALQAAQPER